jgi:uncharacterized membrane protein
MTFHFAASTRQKKKKKKKKKRREEKKGDFFFFFFYFLLLLIFPLFCLPSNLILLGYPARYLLVFLISCRQDLVCNLAIY